MNLKFVLFRFQSVLDYQHRHHLHRRRRDSDDHCTPHYPENRPRFEETNFPWKPADFAVFCPASE